MSESTGTPAGDATPGAGTGANGSGEAISDAASGQAEASGAGEQGASGTDYIAKISSDPAFAAAEVRKHQSRADQVEARNRATEQWIGKLDRYKSQGLSGDDITTHLDNYVRALGNPQLQQVITNFLQTGEFKPQAGNPNTNGSDMSTDDDLYLTDEQKEIRQLKSELESMRGEINRTVTNSGHAALKGHFEKVAAEMGLTGEKFNSVRDSLVQQIKEWENAGEPGRQAIANLQNPKQGEDAVRLLAQKAIGWEGLLEIAKEDVLRQMQKRGELKTDVPSGLAASGMDPPPEFKSAAEALEYAEAHPEVMKGLYQE